MHLKQIVKKLSGNLTSVYIMILHVQGGRKTIKRGVRAQMPKGRGAATCLLLIFGVHNNYT